METILVPVDFSKTSDHAAKYALRIAQQIGNCRLLLLHTVRVGYYETILPSVDYTQYGDEDIQRMHRSLLKKLNNLKDRLSSLCGKHLPIDISIEEGSLLAIINEINTHEKPLLVIIGSNGSSDLNDRVLGTNTIRIAKTSTKPVLVVPPNAMFKPVEKVVLACDFRKITELIPVDSLKTIVKTFGAKLEVLNVNPKGEQLKEDLLQEQALLDKMLNDLDHEYQFTSNRNVAEGILEYAHDSKAQIIISLPRKYSFFESILHDSISTKLTFRSDKPVLLLRSY
ncbi:universal stress protein [Arcticibacter tournemirensis]|uniref:Universal stress protein n=1 Tax=Arcticibacter tournemirensis TaxID=699437 RepID=A0A4Q0M518_9SPHI|nr:universal stress protein [Arcticibacter tournemirensis]RXF68015.1 universal stress protein [Arcticibacter tournemirensis]